MSRAHGPEPISLAEVVRRLDAAGHAPQVYGASTEVLLHGVSLSSQRVTPGDLYAALPGARVQGIDFADAAVEAGAVAILTDRPGAEAHAGGATVPVVAVEAPRAVLGPVAADVFGHPAAAMRTIGITGTQGKTTTSRLAEGALQAAGIRAAVIGTVGTRIAGSDVASALTTPEAPDLQRLFGTMRDRDVAACAMEVSSHALVMGRVEGLVFDVAVFLNLGRDHLDFHADVEDYYRAKARLFDPAHARAALINIDDAHGRRLAGETTLPVHSFSLDDADADWLASDIVSGAEGSSFTIRTPDGATVTARVAVPGRFNVANALAAIAAGAEAGFDLEALAAGLESGGGVPGRLERVSAGQDFGVIVDYAHKPDAVEAALTTLRPLTSGRLLVVIGAGGDRDPGKRPIMGEIAARLADVVVVTDDNPRTEDPAAIRAAVLDGTRLVTHAEPGGVVEIGDRRAAIAGALERAEPGDIVLIAGKGHETGQEIHGTVHPFDDREVARALLGGGR